MTIAMQEMTGMVVETTRFGRVEVTDDRLLTLAGGLLGFEDEEAYCLLNHAPDSPFLWLQSCHRPDLAFVVVDPFTTFSDYSFELDDIEAESLRITDPTEIAVLAVVTIKQQRITANLVGPIVANTRTRQAKQVVLTDSHYTTRHSLI